MNSKNVILGICLLVAPILMVIIYGILTVISFGLISTITFGLDWTCCCSVSALMLLAGIVLLIVGLVQKKD